MARISRSQVGVVRRNSGAAPRGNVSEQNAPDKGNRLLDHLPAAERDAVLAAGELVTLHHGQELHRQEGPLNAVYFLTRGVCSTIIETGDGRAVEAATIGNEGMVGVQAYLGLDFAPHRSLTHMPGAGIRLTRAAFVDIVRRGGALDRTMRCYVAYTLRSAHQTVACNALHAVEQRACRLLLMTHDRSNHNHIHLTHEFLAAMLGVHRQTVSVVAADLQRAGLITYRRGEIEIRDAEGLRAATCECYATTRRLYERIMG